MLRIVVLALCFLLPTFAGASERTIIILDGSGSMWGRIDGKPKLEIAREALGQVLGKLPASAEIGLMAYGHREKGNCRDIELVVPPASGQAGKIVEAARRLRFLGKTPLSEAVRQAAAALRYTEDKSTVILITDGIETCDADPCALGTELKKNGVGFTAHVVGFGLSREEGHQVACLAENTGGRYIQAGNAGELRDALSRTVAAAPPEKPEKKEAVTSPPAQVSTRSKPSIGQSFPVEWTGPDAKRDYVDIVPVGETKIGGELSYTYVAGGKSLSIRAPGKPGDYDLRYVWEGPDGRRVLATARFHVSDSPNALVAPASVAAGTSFDVIWKGPGQKGDYVDIVPQGYGNTGGEISYAYVEQDSPARLKAPGETGTYQLRYVLEAPNGRRVLVSVPLEVTPSRASVAFPSEAVAGTSITVSWKGPAAAGDYVDIVPVGHKEASGETAYAYVEQSEDKETISLKMPGEPGSYRIRYILEAAGGRKIIADEPITVTPATASLKAPASAPKGKSFRVEWTGPGASGDYVDIVPAGYTDTSGELAYFYTEAIKGEPGTLNAPDTQGRYEIRYILEAAGGRKVLARLPIDIR
jgi:Ca-activated chloride channel homolog